MHPARKPVIQQLQTTRNLAPRAAKKLEARLWKYGTVYYGRVARLMIANTAMDLQDIDRHLLQHTVSTVQRDDGDEYVVEGEVACGKCGCRRVKKFELQTRSGDESATTFYKCVECKAQWKK